jgi:AraC-like DNA-binding protein
MRALEVLLSLLLGNYKKGQTSLFFTTSSEHQRHLMAQEYHSQLYFNAEQNKLSVPKSIWYTPSPLSDKDSHQLNVRKCQQLADNFEQERNEDIAVKRILRDCIEKRILSGELGSEFPSLQTISHQLHQSERTLVRKLSQRNTTYSQIVEDQRKYFADQLLVEARYTVADVSEILGYNESTSFCRAFKNWFGVSPSTYRRNPQKSN